MWNLLACVAGLLLNTGKTSSQIITYLLIFLLPIIIISLMCSVLPMNPKLQCFLMATILRGTPWPLRGHRGPICHRHSVRLKVRNRNQVPSTTTSHWIRAHLFALAVKFLKVGCRFESWLQLFRRNHQPCLCALAGTRGRVNHAHFDSDSFKIRVDNHASYCMANSPHLFKDLVLSDMGKVNEINDGLAILGKGRFKFKTTNDNGRVHVIKIPNSLYLPKLESCLLSPQHWTQEAGNSQIWMGNFAHCCVLHWRGGKKTVPFDSSSNTPIFYTASSSSTYRAFAATFEAMEAPFFLRETVLQLPPGQRFLREHAVPEEFVAEEDLHRDTTKSVDMVDKDNKTVCTLNLPSPPIEEGPSNQSIRRGPLTFNPTPLETKDEASPITAADDQAKLMLWHY
jgi:hypothetical protein